MKKKNLQTAILILATFFNPLGFDALFALVMKWTGSYWITDGIFYCLSAFFFGLYFWLSGRPLRSMIPTIRKGKSQSID
jgi:hypothetical protein